MYAGFGLSATRGTGRPIVLVFLGMLRPGHSGNSASFYCQAQAENGAIRIGSDTIATAYEYHDTTYVARSRGGARWEFQKPSSAFASLLH